LRKVFHRHRHRYLLSRGGELNQLTETEMDVANSGDLVSLVGKKVEATILTLVM